MKNSGLLLILLVMVSSCSKKMVVKKDVSKDIGDVMITYNLPKNEISIKVDYEIIKTSPSIFVKDEYQDLLIDEIDSLLNNKFFTAYLERDTVYKIKSIQILEQTVPDTNKLFSIIVEHPKWFEIFKKMEYSVESNSLGTLSSSNYTYDNYALDFSMDITSGLIQYLFKSETNALDGDGRVIMDEEMAKLELRKIIKKINELERRKELIICDSLSGFDRKYLKDEISLIDKELGLKYALLKGKKHAPISKSKIFKYQPGTNKYLLFSKESGFSEEEGDTLLVTTISYDNFNRSSVLNYQNHYLRKESGLAYNKPRLCEIQVVKNNELVTSKKTYIPQLGTIGYIDVKGLNHLSSTLTLDPKTGALLKAGNKSSLLADPSKYGSGIAEAIKGIEKKEESALTPEIDKQISELEKKFRLLELQTKIDSLESLQIDP